MERRLYSETAALTVARIKLFSFVILPPFTGRTLNWLFASAVALGIAGGTVRASTAEENAKKANYLVNCAHFIQWPAKAFSSAEAPLTIGVLGENPFGSSLEKLTRNETIRGRHIQIVHTQSLAKAMDCHLLFIGEETSQLRTVLKGLASRSVVTVGETDSFLAAGGMIALKSERSSVRLRINNTMVHAANVTMSSKLLRIAAQR